MSYAATGRRPHGHSRWVKARGLATVAAVAAMALAARTAHADEAVHFHYSAPPECPAESQLLSAVTDVGGAFRIASPGERARTLEVVIEPTGRGFTGSLAVRGLAGDERVRTVTCGRCESAVRALGLVMAMALEDAAPAPVPDEPSPPVTPVPEPSRIEAPEPVTAPPPPQRDDEQGGIAAMAIWGSFSWTPTGAEMLAVAPGSTRLGGVAALTSENVNDTRYQLTPTYALAAGHGESVRLGGVAGWGAPFSHDDWFGLLLEGGLRGGVVNGDVWPIDGNLCFSTSAFNGPACTTGPGAPKTWRFLSPYVAGTTVLQLLPKLPVRPFVALTFLLSGDYRGNTTGTVSVDAGLAWRSW
jgi:hypothetical protein